MSLGNFKIFIQKSKWIGKCQMLGQHGSLILTSTNVLGVVGLDEHGSSCDI